jgi:hypothetical protein
MIREEFCAQGGQRAPSRSNFWDRAAIELLAVCSMNSKRLKVTVLFEANDVSGGAADKSKQ